MMCQECRAVMRCGALRLGSSLVSRIGRESLEHMTPADALRERAKHYLVLAENAPGSLMPNSYRDVAAVLEREAEKVEAEEAGGHFRD